MMIMMLCAVVLLVLLMWAWRTLDWVWFTPKRIERELRRKGLRGTHYRIFYGDSKDFSRLMEDARSRPLPLHCHDIAPRVIPFVHNIIKDHGLILLFNNSLHSLFLSVFSFWARIICLITTVPIQESERHA